MRIKDNKIWDTVRGQWLVLTPEEWVRQHFVRYLVEELKVEPHRIGREVLLQHEPAGRSGRGAQRADLVVYDLRGEPSLIVECKAQSVPLNLATLEQVSRYNTALGGVPYLAVTNGRELYCFLYDPQQREYISIPSLPASL